MGKASHISDLERVQYHGDEYMAAFLQNWQNIAENVVDEMPDVTLASMLLERIKHSIELKSDIDQYDRYGSRIKIISTSFCWDACGVALRRHRRTATTNVSYSMLLTPFAPLLVLQASRMAGSSWASRRRRPIRTRRIKRNISEMQRKPPQA